MTPLEVKKAILKAINDQISMDMETIDFLESQLDRQMEKREALRAEIKEIQQEEDAERMGHPLDE